MTTDAFTARAQPRRAQLIRASLRRRHLSRRSSAASASRRSFWRSGFVALLFTDIIRKGVPAFTQSNLHLTVTYDPAVITVGPAPVRAAGQSDADFRDASLKWQREVALLNWNKIVEAVAPRRGAGGLRDQRQGSPGDRRDRRAPSSARAFVDDPVAARTNHQGRRSRLGQRRQLDQGQYRPQPRPTTSSNSRLRRARSSISSSRDGTISMGFAWSLLTNVDSRAAPAAPASSAPSSARST